MVSLTKKQHRLLRAELQYKVDVDGFEKEKAINTVATANAHDRSYAKILEETVTRMQKNGLIAKSAPVKTKLDKAKAIVAGICQCCD